MQPQKRGFMKKKIEKPNKTQLIVAIQSMLRNGCFETQDDICQALEKKGFDVTQVTISRIMNKLGAVKMNEDQKMVYRLPVETTSIKAQDALSQFVLNILRNEVLIVIHVAPGSAQLVARLLDQQHKLGILGTIAGDDTIVVIPEKVAQIDQLMKKVSELLLGKGV